MRPVFAALAWLFIVVSIVFAVLPMGQLAYLPTGLAVVFSALTLFLSKPADENGGKDQKKRPKIMLIVSVLLLVIVAAKAMMPDEVEEDQQFEKQKTESQNEDLKDLEELESAQ